MLQGGFKRGFKGGSPSEGFKGLEGASRGLHLRKALRGLKGLQGGFKAAERELEGT